MWCVSLFGFVYFSRPTDDALVVKETHSRWPTVVPHPTAWPVIEGVRHPKNHPWLDHLGQFLVG